jgi:predicted HTH domain antitoxin
MANIQIRVPDDEVRGLDDLADDLGSSRSETARAALHEGLRLMRTRRALDLYAEGRLSLERAAEYAGVDLAGLANEAARRGLPYFRYSAGDLDRDRRTLRRRRSGTRDYQSGQELSR